MRSAHWMIGLAILPAVLAAQAKAPAAGGANARAAASEPMTEAEQIASSVLALPGEYRATAKILGYRAGSKELVTLRDGAGPFTCLASPPGGPLHLACYHNSMEPFMARGRALRAQGVKDEQVDTVRFAEVKSGKLPMPKQPAALYQVFGGRFDAAADTVIGGRSLFVAYIPGATGASTGLSEKPAQTGPWIMFPGTPKAHIMLAGKM